MLEVLCITPNTCAGQSSAPHWRALQYGLKVLCQSFVIIIHIRVSCGSKVCWRLNWVPWVLMSILMRCQKTFSFVLNFLFFSVRPATSLRFVHVRMLVAGQPATATMNCGSRLKKVTMNYSETVLAELALAARLHDEEIQGCKRDLRKAYWQVPRSQEGPRIFMIFWHAPSGDVRARELFSEDFGAASAVWCCNRVFKALVFVLQYFFLLPIDYYYDDCWMFSAPWSMRSASFVLDRAIEVLGYQWKKEKHDSTLPLPLLGLSFNVVDGRALIENTRERKRNLVQELVALKSSAPICSVVGKLVFAGKGLCGRAGVHARRPLYQALKDFSIHRQAGVWPAHVLEAIAVCAETLFSATSYITP